jgi:abequosyltransferase
MTSRPLLSLCIPTYNRAAYFQEALESGLREWAGQPAGLVELLVCDNASTDDTPARLAQAQARHPELKVFRNAENLGFDGNYLRCVEEATGEFVWVMGDDDVWLPGSIARILRELEAGADACLCLAEACDLNLNPLITLPWYLDANPPLVWRLETRDDLIRYFDACARNAGAFAFISVAVFRRDRFLKCLSAMEPGIAAGYPHLLGMMAYLRQPLRLHYIPEALIRNRMSDLHANSYANNDLYGRLLQDLHGWAHVADAVFGDDPGIHTAFSHILGRNHHDTILPSLRRCVPGRAEWLQAAPYLVRAGFSPVQVAAADVGFQHLQGERLPMRTLNPVALCLADLALVARGARHIAVLILGGLPNLLEGAALLAALRHSGDAQRVRVFCPSDCIALLDGFDVACLDPKRYLADETYRDVIAKGIAEFAPELVVNLDPARGIEGDDLVIVAQPAGAIGFELPDRQQEAALIKAVNGAYSCLVPEAAGVSPMVAALGLEPVPAGLWPSPGTQEEAQRVLAGLGWDPATTLAVLVDHPSIAEAPTFQRAFVEALAGPWTFVGIGGRGTYATLETLLGPLDGRAVNLAGALSLGPMAALLNLCGRYLGGTPFLQGMANTCGCQPITAEPD